MMTSKKMKNSPHKSEKTAWPQLLLNDIFKKKGHLAAVALFYDLNRSTMHPRVAVSFPVTKTEMS